MNWTAVDLIGRKSTVPYATDTDTALEMVNVHCPLLASRHYPMWRGAYFNLAPSPAAHLHLVAFALIASFEGLAAIRFVE